MKNAVADTHALIWYLTTDRRLGQNADAFFKACDDGAITIFIPTICLVEIIYLVERGTVPAELRHALTEALGRGRTGLRIIDLTTEIVDHVATIVKRDVPEMPDRIIAATALFLNVPVLTRDHRIQQSSVETIW